MLMRIPDLDRQRSEKQLSLSEFLKTYNEGLPVEFPRVSPALLREFRKTHLGLFKNSNLWTLDQHRKTVMNWLPSATIPR
jgi:hypothetical protein